MAVSSLSLNLASSTTTLHKKLNLPTATSISSSKPSAFSLPSTITCSRDLSCSDEDEVPTSTGVPQTDKSRANPDDYLETPKRFKKIGNCKRRPLLLGVGALALSLLPTSSLLAEEIPANYAAYVDTEDGYSYVYPSDWRDFDYRGHDSSFKDRYVQLQNVRLSFIPTDKSDIREMGSLEEYIPGLLKRAYAAPSQRVTIYDMQERTTDDKTYYTFEYMLASRNYSRTAFATIAIANGRYYILIVGAVARRWRRVRNQLKVVADSFKVLDI